MHAEGMEEEAMYNILPVSSDLVPPNTYWHELFQGFAYVGNTAKVIMTVNKRYLPTNTNNPLFNRLRLKLQGI